MSSERIRQIVGEILERSQELQGLVADPATPPPPAGDVIRVKPGDNVGAAFDQIQKTGGTLLCAPGLYDGVNLIARPRPRDSKVVVIRSDTTNLPRDGQRITREFAPGIAVFQSKTTEQTFKAENGSANVAFLGVGFGPTPFVDRTLVGIGSDKRYMKTPAETPSGFTFDRVLMFGQDGRGQHQGIRANGMNITGKGCSFYDFVEPGRDSQAMSGWNGSINHVWENCFFEAASENVMYGGSDCPSAEMNPRNVLFRRCTFSKNRAWNSWANNGSIKCLFEIKNVTDLKVEACLFEHNWPDSWPTGVAIVLKASNQESTAPWSTCENVEIVDCIIRECGDIFALVGWADGYNATSAPNKVSQRMKNVAIRNVLAYNVNGPNGQGRGMPCANTPDGLTVDHVSMIQNKIQFHNFWFHGNQPRGSRIAWTNSIMFEGSYGGVWVTSPYATDGVGSAAPQGLRALKENGYREVVFEGNVIGRGGRTSDWGPTNPRLDPTEIMASLDEKQRVKAGSPVALAAKTTDGKAPGADVDLLLSRIGDVI